jgi:hypothetical protein
VRASFCAAWLHSAAGTSLRGGAWLLYWPDRYSAVRLQVEPAQYRSFMAQNKRLRWPCSIIPAQADLREERSGVVTRRRRGALQIMARQALRFRRIGFQLCRPNGHWCRRNVFGDFHWARSRAPQQLPIKEFALFESPQGGICKLRQLRGAQGIRCRRTSGTGRPFFWFFSLGVQRKEQISG